MQVRIGAVVLGAFIALPPAPAHAAGVPYNDPRSSGTIGICDAHGRTITSGRLADTPFAAKVVGSDRPEGAYGGKGATAYLLGYQPRKGIDAGNWSGEQLTAASTYSNHDHPMAEVTYGDVTLVQLASDYPPQWNGLLQLRLYFTVPGQAGASPSYPTTDIQVTGGTWRVVRGGGGACSAGSAVSVARTLAPGSVSSPAATAASAGTTGTPRTASSTPSSAAATASPSPQATVKATDKSSGASGLPVWGALTVVAFLAGIGAFWWRRRSGGLR
jgi:hypothetical protein